MLRLVLRRPSAKKSKASKKPLRNSVAYVPEDQVAELRAQTWCASLLTLAQMSEPALIKHLVSIGVLQTFVCCPHCGLGKLSALRKDKNRGYVRRCRAKVCQKFVLLHSHHPVFVTSWGNSHVPLRHQVLVLFCLVAKVEQGKVHLLTGLG